MWWLEGLVCGPILNIKPQTFNLNPFGGLVRTLSIVNIKVICEPCHCMLTDSPSSVRAYSLSLS
jgi:hypothetical protein